MKKHPTIVVIGVALATLTFLSACSSEPTDPVASARKLADAPTWVSKPTGVDCGDVRLEGQSTFPQKNLDCMSTAGKAGHAAFLTWTERTAEGDPLPHFARTAGSGFTVAATSAYDTYGHGGWSESTCSNVARIPRCADSAS